MTNVKGFIKNRVVFALFAILLLGSILRFYRLSQFPISLYWDEVSIGYNAFSIGETLKDEHGVFLPLLFRAYDDYKLPLYIYTDAIFVKALGLNELSVRFPSALSGILSILFIYLLVKKLFEESKTKINPKALALISSFLFAISPWSIQFSRGGFEANLALFLVIAGTYFFIRTKESIKYLPISLFIFSLAFYTYRSVYLFLPFLIGGLVIFWRKEVFRIGIFKLFIIFFLFLLLIAPIFYSTLTLGKGRVSQTSISNEVNELANKFYLSGKPEERHLLFAQVFVKNYFSEISPAFLFFTGDPNGRHSARGMGVMYIWELPFLLVGIIVLILKMPAKVKGLFLVWLIAFSFPVALTTPSPHALRGLNGVPVLEITVGIGIYYFINFFPKKFRKIVILTLSVIIFAGLLRYGALYKSSSIKTASDWGDGYKQLYQYLIPLDNKYDKVVVSGHYWQPYAYALFYGKYNPRDYQLNGTPAGFSNFYFGGTAWDADVGRSELDSVNLREMFPNKRVLVALSPVEYESQKVNIDYLHEVKNSADKTVFIVGKLK